jgi:PAS domain S-box-containing protein
MTKIDATEHTQPSDQSPGAESAKPPIDTRRNPKLRQRTIRFRLAGLVLACVLPVCAIAGLLVYYAYQHKRQLTEQRVLETARALSMVVDQRFATMQAVAATLATSSFLVSGNMAAFNKQAQTALQAYPGYVVAVSDANGQEFVNTAVPFGTPLPIRGALDVMQRVFTTGKPAFTNLYEGTRSKKYVFGIHVPVFRDGRVVYDLDISEHPETFQQVFSQQHIPPEWAVAIHDANYVLVARSRFQERYVGRQASPGFAKRVGEVAEGTIEDVNPEGAPVLSAFHRSPMSGWSVAIGVPKAVMTADIRQWLWWTVGGAILLLMTGIALALFLARRITGSIQALIPPALALGTGEPVDLGPLDLAEANEVGQSLVKASQLLQQRNTERQQAEEALIAAKELAEKTSAQFRANIDSMTEGMYVVGTDGKRLLTNPAYFKIHGFDPAPAEEFASSISALLERYDLNGRLLSREEWPVSRALRGETVLQSQQRVRRVDTGNEVILSVNAVPLRDAAGNVTQAVVTIEDITAQKQSEAALLRSEKLASVGRMAATVSHEINNPLAAVTNLLFLANSVNDLPESARQYLEAADTELKRIAHITRQSLGFYRESNAPALMSVNAVLESAVDLQRGRIKTKRAVIEKQWNEEVELTAVAGELRQVFSNLLANSLDAIDEEGIIKLRVSANAASNSHRCVRVTVADNGKGIETSLRRHIFEPFFTTKGTIGTGLGLWVSKQIIGKHDGTIRMRSRSDGPRRGTTFSIVLPVESAAAAHSQSAGA